MSNNIIRYGVDIDALGIRRLKKKKMEIYLCRFMTDRVARVMVCFVSFPDIKQTL